MRRSEAGWGLDQDGRGVGRALRKSIRSGDIGSQDSLKGLRPGQLDGHGDSMAGLRFEMPVPHCHADIRSELAHLDVEFEGEAGWESSAKGRSLSHRTARAQPEVGLGEREACGGLCARPGDTGLRNREGLTLRGAQEPQCFQPTDPSPERSLWRTYLGRRKEPRKKK